MSNMVVFESFQPPEMIPFSICLEASERELEAICDKEFKKLSQHKKEQVDVYPRIANMIRSMSAEALASLPVTETCSREITSSSSNTSFPALSPALKRNKKKKRNNRVRFAEEDKLENVIYLPQKHVVTARNSRRANWEMAPFHDEYWDGNKRCFRKVPLTQEEVKILQTKEGFTMKNTRFGNNILSYHDEEGLMNNIYRVGRLMKSELLSMLFE